MGSQNQRSDPLDTGVTPLSDEDPRQIGRYELIGILGTGGMGRVFLGYDGDKLAAIKVVKSELVGDDSFLLHFGRELDNLDRLPEGLSTRLLGAERTGRHPWFATEYVPGLTVAEALQVLGTGLPARPVWLLLREAAESLAQIHALDMIHRDLKPSNVILTMDGLKVIDFGVARAVDQSRLTLTGQAVGTPAYMSPEQVTASELTGAADVFGLASLITTAATMRPPFGDGQGPDVLYRIVNGVPSLGDLIQVDPELAALVERCLAKDPAQRPGAAELAAAAAEALAVDPAPVRWPQDVRAQISKRHTFATDSFAWPTKRLAGRKAAERVLLWASPRVPDQPETPEAHVSPAAAGVPESPATPRNPGKSGATGKTRRTSRLNRDPAPRRRRSARMAMLCSAAILGALSAAAVLDPRVPSQTNDATNGDKANKAAVVIMQTPGSPSSTATVAGTATAVGQSAGTPTQNAAAPPPVRPAATHPASSGGSGNSPAPHPKSPSPSPNPPSPPPVSPPPPPPPGPAGPGGDADYVSGSEVEASGCDGWLDKVSGGLDGTVSAGDATCEADLNVTYCSEGDDGTGTGTAADYKESDIGYGAYFCIGDWILDEQICVWNESDPNGKVCSPVYDDASGDPVKV